MPSVMSRGPSWFYGVMITPPFEMSSFPLGGFGGGGGGFGGSGIVCSMVTDGIRRRRPAPNAWSPDFSRPLPMIYDPIYVIVAPAAAAVPSLIRFRLLTSTNNSSLTDNKYEFASVGVPPVKLTRTSA